MLLKRTLSISVILLLLLAGVFAPASSRTTYAHADYHRSEPAAGVHVDASPASVKVWFIEAVDAEGSSLSVLNAAAAAVDLGDSTIDSSDPNSKLLVVSLNPDLPEGTYTVQWTTLSAVDGDEVSGEFTFIVGAMMGDGDGMMGDGDGMMGDGDGMMGDGDGMMGDGDGMMGDGDGMMGDGDGMMGDGDGMMGDGDGMMGDGDGMMGDDDKMSGDNMMGDDDKMSGDSMPATLPMTGDDATVPAAAGMVVFGLLALAAGLTIRKVSLTSR